ncbi:hypothetical protein Aduo_000735 [Ancylostoma duodenale]
MSASKSSNASAPPKGVVFKSGSLFDVVGLRIFKYKGSEYLVYGNGPCIAIHPIRRGEITSSPTAELMLFYPKHTPLEMMEISDQGVVVATSGSCYALFRFAEILEGGFMCRSRLLRVSDSKVLQYSIKFAPGIRFADPKDASQRLVSLRIMVKHGVSTNTVLAYSDRHKFCISAYDIKDFIEIFGVNVILTLGGALYVGYDLRDTKQEQVKYFAKSGVRQLCQLDHDRFLTGDQEGFISAYRACREEGAIFLGKINLHYGSVSSLYMVDHKHLIAGYSTGGLARFKNICKWPSTLNFAPFPGMCNV